MPQDMEWAEWYAQFQLSLSTVQERTSQIGIAFVRDVLEEILTVISKVPPQPARDRAVRFNTYVRTIGHYPRSAFYQRATGQWRRKSRLRESEKVKIRYTSQQSSDRWEVNVFGDGTVVSGSLQNTATYSGWLFGPLDASLDPHQVDWHNETGWVSEDQALATVMPEVDRRRQELANQIVTLLIE